MLDHDGDAAFANQGGPEFGSKRSDTSDATQCNPNQHNTHNILTMVDNAHIARTPPKRSDPKIAAAGGLLRM